MTAKENLAGGQPAGDAIAVAQALTHAVDALAEKVGTLNEDVAAQREFGRRNRRMIWGLIVSITLDLVLTVGIALVAVAAQEAHDSAKQVRASQISICESSNVSRKQNLQLWEYVLSVPTEKPPTERQKKTREDFRRYIGKVFAPRDCSKI